MAVKTIIKSLVQQAKQQKGKQIISLLASYGLSLVLGIGTSVVNTRLLGADSGFFFFFSFLFYFSIFSLFLMVFFSVGIFHTGGRLIAYKKIRESKATNNWNALRNYRHHRGGLYAGFFHRILRSGSDL